MSIKFKRLLFYLFSLLVSTINGFSIIGLIDHQVPKDDLIEYYGRALIFGYLLTAIVFVGIFVSLSLNFDLNDKFKEKDSKLILHSSIISFCLVQLLYFIKLF